MVVREEVVAHRLELHHGMRLDEKWMWDTFKELHTDCKEIVPFQTGEIYGAFNNVFKVGDRCWVKVNTQYTRIEIEITDRCHSEYKPENAQALKETLTHELSRLISGEIAAERNTK